MLCKFSVFRKGFIKACKLKIVFGMGLGGGGNLHSIMCRGARKVFISLSPLFVYSQPHDAFQSREMHCIKSLQTGSF